MYRMIDPMAAWSVADSLAQTGANIAALASRIRLLIPESNGLDAAGRSVAWWKSTAADLKRRVALLEPTSRPAPGAEWIQGPPRRDDLISPTEAAAFFARLGPLEAMRLAGRFPDQVGPVEGAPPAVRYQANHVLAVRYLEDLRRRRRAIIASNGPGFSFTPDDLRDLYRSIGRPFTDLRRLVDEDLAMLDRQIADAARWADRDRQFLRFDPSGDGQIIEVLGELESSRHVAIVVPGVGNEIANYERGLRRSATSLHDSADRSDASVIAWLGYDAPDDLLAAMNRHPVAAAESLTGFLRGLEVSIKHGVHRSLIGHSYGSVVTGEALQAGAAVEEVVFIGSPGVGVDHVSDLELPASTHVWAGRAASDPILLARDLECFDPAPICHPSADRLFFGLDPTDPAFGATRFAVDDAPIRDAHSSYFKQGSASLHNLTSIFLGQDHLVTRPGSRIARVSE